MTTTPSHAGLAIGTKHLEWTWWQSEASGKLVPAVNTADPLSWANSWDANNVGTVDVSFAATDAVLNAGSLPKSLHFDLIAPHTTHTSEPVGATSFVWNPQLGQHRRQGDVQGDGSGL